MAATGSSYGDCNSHYGPPFEACMQPLMGHLTSPSRRHKSRRLTSSPLGLQLLVVRGDYFKEQFAKLSEELVWLRWYDFPYEKIPSWLSRGKLRVLELYGDERLAELWGPNDPPPSQLRELIINLSWADSCNLQMIPETVGRIPINISSLPEEFCRLESLEHLELRNFSHLSSLPIHFGNLRKLKYIDLSGCKTLTALPVFFNQLTELQYLDLSKCGNLKLENDILENITKLEKLRLSGCSKLQQLPSEITRQMYLRELCLVGTGLRELPVDIDRLAKLEVLEIGSRYLTSLPTSLGNLSSLIKLNIQHCYNLKCLPTSLGCLTRLENMELYWLGVEYLPEGFGQLVNLQNLRIWHCPIKDLPLANPEKSYSKKLPRLKSIDLLCTKVSTISISEDCCPSLENLNVKENHDLMEIETLPTTLKSVNIHTCEKLQKIMNCPGLDKLPSFAGLVQLQSITITKCPQLEELPSFACCTCLNTLWIFGDHRVTKIEGLEELTSLTGLRLQTCWKEPGIKRLKNQDKLTTLEIIAESRSAIETCIPPNILKTACTMEIVGRAVEDVESVVGSLRFPNFTVVDTLHRSAPGEWQMKLPLSNASCMMACFVVSCSSPGIKICASPVSDLLVSLLEGKQVYIGVWPKAFPFNSVEDSERVFLTLETYGSSSGIEIEKGMAVIMRKGEEENKALEEALHKFLELLAR